MKHEEGQSLWQANPIMLAVKSATENANVCNRCKTCWALQPAGRLTCRHSTEELRQKKNLVFRATVLKTLGRVGSVFVFFVSFFKN